MLLDRKELSLTTSPSIGKQFPRYQDLSREQYQKDVQQRPDLPILFPGKLFDELAKRFNGMFL
jgi:hypothetical protein